VNARLEEARLPHARYQAVFSASAIHWVDPDVGWRVVADALINDGTLALVSYFGLEDSRSGKDQQAFRAALARVAPELALEWPRSLDLSDAAITLLFRAADRRRRAAALAATPSDAEITIDGTEQPFVLLTTPGGRWVAVRRHDDLTITIAARDLDPATISLEPVADPAARLLGPEPQDPSDARAQ
jgi:hypothetical protein